MQNERFNQSGDALASRIDIIYNRNCKAMVDGSQLLWSISQTERSNSEKYCYSWYQPKSLRASVGSSNAKTLVTSVYGLQILVQIYMTLDNETQSVKANASQSCKLKTRDYKTSLLVYPAIC